MPPIPENVRKRGCGSVTPLECPRHELLGESGTEGLSERAPTVTVDGVVPETSEPEVPVPAVLVTSRTISDALVTLKQWICRSRSKSASVMKTIHKFLRGFCGNAMRNVME